MLALVVQAGSTAKLGTVQGDLKVGRGATITAEDGRRVTVAGEAHFEGPVTIACDLECGMMRVEGRGFGPSGDVVAKGSLLVHGDLEIDASANVSGTITAERVDVGGHLESASVASKGVRVGGHMKVRGSLKTGDVDAGGHLTVDDRVDITNLRVGGHAEVGGGVIGGDIMVRGHFRTTKPIAFGFIQVYGSLKLPAGSNGERLNSLGKVEFEGDSSCKTIEVSGTATAQGNLAAETIKINGKLNVGGSLAVKGKLEVLGSAETRGQVDCGALLVGGKMIADRASVEARADVGGQLWTTRGLKASEVAIGTGSRVNGPIIGQKVEVGKGIELGSWGQVAGWRTFPLAGRMTRVDDVYGKEVWIDRYSQAKRIFAEKVRMQSGSMADEVNYTNEADISDGVHLEKPPRKVDRLPASPF
jgi:cytoskeletal protein CcmA (bactofilin family)